MTSGFFDLHRFETSGGAQVFRLPLQAFPNFTTHTYLILVDDLIVLVDAGFGNEQSNAAIEAGFSRVGQMLGRTIRVSDLTHILITHGHIDHFCGLMYLRRETGAQVAVHELDLHILTHHEERLALIAPRLYQFLIEAGIPVGERDNLLNLYRFTKEIYRSTPVDFTYGARDMKVGPFEMLHIPGHCPGHVAIRLHDVVFSGDHVLEGMITHQSPETLVPYTGLGHYLDSLHSLEEWAGDVHLVFAGHGDPLRNLPGRAQSIRTAIDEKLDQVLGFMAEPHTIAETTAHLYPDQQGYNGLLVLEKTGAFVEYLYQRSLLEIVNYHQLESGQSVALYYRRISH